MEHEPLRQLATGFATWQYLGVLVLWYFLYGTFARRVIYEKTRRGILLPFFALADDLALQLPGRKAALIKKQVDASLAVGDEHGGYLGNDEWTHRNIRDKNLYAEVGNAELPGMVYVSVVTFPLLYPAWFWAWNSVKPMF